MDKEGEPLINRRVEELTQQRFDGICQPCLAEFIGTCMFVFIGCMSVQDPLGPASKDNAPNAGAVAVAHGFTIALLAVAFGGISGGHFNPAVTLGVWIAGGIKPGLALVYMVVQFIGAVLGAGLCRGVLTEHVYVDVIRGGAHTLGPDVSPAQGILAEAVMTLLLVLTFILSAVDEQTKSPLAPLAIGFAVTCDILAGLSTTGASMNPARSAGPAIALTVYDSSVWKYHYVYWAGPVIGATLAGILYRLFFASSDKRFILQK
ncbi:aquaporin-8-like isoform X1 [Gigantopelta aegis]|uniref:aquaporin-8-like isoform X1 n=1 Tax=Gigantopelta aegis TaxID=1735272 RepID=UPI001B889646|nr:aquaporin-8-like isoform X1 [Gigantopelta aegis]XP_041363392.1 aquaporin-8-like isoform X1 [Gigantopelta aegis]